MKRYAGRRTKPRLSQWCATKHYQCELIEPAKRGHNIWQPVRVPGHAVCRSKRWHDPDHLECCAGVDERESYACQCACHPPGSWAHGGPRSWR